MSRSSAPKLRLPPPDPAPAGARAPAAEPSARALPRLARRGHPEPRCPGGTPPPAHLPSSAAGRPSESQRRPGARRPAVRPRLPAPRSCCASASGWSDAARELTHDYDELLGRLSYAAVPSPTGPDDLLRARRAVARHRRRGRPARRGCARVRERPRRHDRVRHRRSATRACAAGSPTATASSRSGCSSRTGRCRPTRSCSSSSCDAGDEVIVERPTYDRTLLSLRGRGARVHAVRARARRHRHRRARRAARRRAPARAADARAHHPQLPEPRRLHALPREAQARCWSWPQSTASSCSRTTPTWSCASAASRCRRCSRWTPSASCTRRRSPRPCARASASAISSARRI